MEIKKSAVTIKPNYYLIPVTKVDMTKEGMEFFNNEVKKVKDYNKIVRTRSGGISLKNLRLPIYDIRNTNACVELTVVDKTGCYRLQFKNVSKSKNPGISGRQAFNKFVELLKKYNIDLNSYAIDNGPEVKKEISKYLIKLERESFKDIIFTNVHHIDFHNSFPAGLVNTHPEFKEPITLLYKKRKENEVYKAVLNLSIGYMQSEKCCNAKWANLSRDAINDNNRRVLELADKLRESGRMVLSFNTDGIWYQGDIYHGENEGEELGQWHNDHINCKWRAKSAGAYEFIEDDKYYPILRGHTLYDNEKPRDQWTWGDIYNASVLKYGLTENNEIIMIEDEE